MSFYFTRDPFFQNFDRLLNAHLNSRSALGSALDTTDDESNKVSKFWSGPFSARLDFSETDKNYILYADLPGIPKDDVNVSIKDDVLTLSGERCRKNEEKDEQKHIVERSQGKFVRSVRLPQDANVEDVKATMEHGVLELTIGKKAKEEGLKTISIQ
ncbi:HSP20-like chaperone [Chytriomyces sp. MP71]|nr:HSP20-like chaperone [Chytriomyces sp. MP71]